jgi:hypothetical protein
MDHYDDDGPDNELYWDTWDDVLRNAVITEDDDTVYYLDQHEENLTCFA